MGLLRIVVYAWAVEIVCKGIIRHELRDLNTVDKVLVALSHQAIVL